MTPWSLHCLLGRLTRGMAFSLPIAHPRLTPAASHQGFLRGILLDANLLVGHCGRGRLPCHSRFRPRQSSTTACELSSTIATFDPAFSLCVQIRPLQHHRCCLSFDMCTPALAPVLPYENTSSWSNEDTQEVSYSPADDGTIAAVVTSMGGQAGAVAIIRLSGPSAVGITSRIFRPVWKSTIGDAKSNVWRPKSHRVQYGTLVDLTGALVDEALVVPMLAPRSYTKEDVIELQCHGGDVCARRVLQICLEAGARLAQPGEFTLRAFLNGRLDLTQAESVAQVIAAKTSLAADTALAAIQGGLSLLVKSLRKECIDLLVEMEARLDFDDEMPVLDSDLLIKRITCMEISVQQALATSNRGRLLRSGLQVAIVGRPNVGKSSLLNAWSQTERAIVTDVPGTTRDVVETGVVVGGISVTLLDTAGIRKTDDVVENIGVQRSQAAAKGADVVLMVISALDGWTVEDGIIFQQIWGSHESQIARQNNTTGGLAGPMTLGIETSSAAQVPTTTCGAPGILVINKVDKRSSTSVQLPDEVSTSFRKVVSTCALQRVGVESLEQALLQLVELGEVKSEGYQWAVNERQAEQLIRAREALERLKDSVMQQLPLDFWTIDLKEAAIALGQISGDDVSEEVLSNIFSRFCIGK